MQAAFSPSKAEVEAAMRLVAAFKENQDRGHGAFVYEGACRAVLCCVLLRWGDTEPAAAAASTRSVEGLPSRWLFKHKFVCAGWLSVCREDD